MIGGGLGGSELRGQKISDYTVRRLSVYYRLLDELEQQGVEVVSSAALAELAGTNSAQIRKDLSYFGTFGKRGRGYRVAALAKEIKKILGLDRTWRVVLAGAGNLGHALSMYHDFEKHGFSIVGIFDIDPEKIGQVWEGIRVRHLDDCEQVVREEKVELAIIVTPGGAAQEVVDRLRAAGIQGFLNFAPRKLRTDGDVQLRNVDITIELEGLTYALQTGRS
ncbi:MAG: redox-sensing transcriptional repressor Rex [Candidatus Eisenbacteria bacterium]|nr:redox-sensing transcriptional repressor Rex [Candidatus Latescibacterota bacterium]MBD3301144.1 redox-sensing transcriptional repressor Rex [Candidatus Eisenbacteria bacterium]